MDDLLKEYCDIAKKIALAEGEAKGRAKGKAEGEAIGRAKGKLQCFKKYHAELQCIY